MENRLLLALLLAGAGYLAYKSFFTSRETEEEAGAGLFDSAWSWVKESFDFGNQGSALRAVRHVQAENDQIAYISEALVMAIIKVESSFDPNATGAAGEYGLMQIHPVTLKWLANKYGITAYDPYDPVDNVFFGLVYLDILYSKFGDWDAVIHAYNVGPGAYDNGKRNDTYHDKVLSALYEFTG